MLPRPKRIAAVHKFVGFLLSAVHECGLNFEMNQDDQLNNNEYAGDITV
jgi:hypothetical protein